MSILAVDVDNVVVDTPYAWWADLEIRTKRGFTWDYVKGRFDLGKIYDQYLPFGDAADFWRSPSLYDDLQPIEGSVEALEKASEKYTIVFVSALKGNHHKSKYQFLERHFPFMSGLVGTKEKQFVHADVAIDDRNENLNKFHEYNWCTKIRFETPQEQFQPVSGCFIAMTHWDQLSEILRGIE